MISTRKAKQLDATTMFTYSHANTALGQSERAYYLSYFIMYDIQQQRQTVLRATTYDKTIIGWAFCDTGKTCI